MENFNVGDTPISYLFDDEDISHSGIFGMKWGIRRYQNKDGSLTDEGKLRYYGKSDYKRYAAKDNQKINSLASTTFDVYKKLYEQGEDFKTDTDEQKKRKYDSLKKEAYNNATDEWIASVEREFKQAQDINAYAISRINTGKQVLSTSSDLVKEASSLVPNVKGKESHPDYSSMTNEQLKQQTERLNLETNYARAAGQMIYTPSKQELTRERMRTIGSVLDLMSTAVSGIVLPIVIHRAGLTAPGKDGGKKK